MTTAEWITELWNKRYIKYYELYVWWYDRAVEWDSGTDWGAAFYGDHLLDHYQGGWLDYSNAYLPMYNVFVLHKSIPTAGISWGIPLAIAGGLIGTAIVLTRRRK